MTAPRLVMVEGVAPGIGKSTLATSLARVLQADGTPVDLFPEEEPRAWRATYRGRRRNQPGSGVWCETYAGSPTT
ncbi:hypothetical protein ACWDWO_21750 [Actinopolymorpha singaporensis]